MVFRNNRYYTRQYCGKTDKGFLKFNYELGQGITKSLFVFCVTVEGRRDWKKILYVEMW